ncbi:MAG: dipeptidyl acylaminoacyl-peptidase [uncultured archaeon A07HR60]|nr:MAG: dipeptidyl acylaminoacyl-peptidase [uncultured archaeon A07HR60]
MEEYDIERYLNIRSAGVSDFGVDGRLAFRYDATGTSQLWTLTGPGDWPEQRTFFDERVTFAEFSPERAELAFGMDEGGNERAQLYRLDLTTGTVTNLTRHPDAKHRWGGWCSDGSQFAFTSNRRDQAVFDVYIQDREGAGDDAELVSEGDGWLSLAGWHPDDEQLLLSKAHSSFDQDLYAVDVGTGDRTHLTPHEGEARFGRPEWGPDGDSVYCVTDHDADTLRLERIDCASQERSVVVDGDGWNVDGVSIHQETGRVVYTRNVDGYTQLTVGEFDGPETIAEFPTPALPDGVAGGVAFDPAGDRIAVSASGRTANGNAHVVDIETGETEQWTFASTAGIPEDGFVAPELIEYPSFDDRKIPGFFSMPETEPPAAGYPTIVDIHGGPESQRRPSFSSVRQYFLNHGYAVFEPNVRGSSGYGRTYSELDDVENRLDSVADIKSAVEWLSDYPEVDPDRVAVKGGSYGGFMVLSALTEYPELWAAGIDIVGIANFVTFLENTGDWRRSLREREYGSLEDDRAFLEEISPINNVESIQAPLFVLHGANDPRVPVDEARQIAEEAGEQGVPVRKLIFDDEGHGFSKRDNQIEAYSEIVEFLDTHV